MTNFTKSGEGRQSLSQDAKIMQLETLLLWAQLQPQGHLPRQL